MKKIMLTTIGFVSGVSLLSYSLSQALPFVNKTVTGNGQTQTAQRSVTGFDKINVAGEFDVKLHQGQKSALSIRADSNLLPYIITNVNNGVLTITVKSDTNIKPNDDIDINVTLPNLTSLSNDGHSDIESKNLKATHLVINNSGAGDIDLEGQIQLKTINAAGSGDIEIKGVTPDHLVVKGAGSGDIELSGKVGLVSLNSQGKRDVDITGIQSQNISVQTAGESEIELSGIAKALTVNLAGSGEIKAKDLNVDKATVRIYGSGNVYTNASQQLTVSIAGSGNVFYKAKPKDLKQQVFGVGKVQQAS